MYTDYIKIDYLYSMYYAMVTAVTLVASCYLLFRRGNAFNPEITPPLHLRRWAAAFLGSLTCSHIWYMPMMYATNEEDARTSLLVGALLDFITVFPLSIVLILTMLQNRKRHTWTVPLTTLPLIVLTVWCLVSHDDSIILYAFGYIALFGVFMLIYITVAIRDYGRWLRDNYADLEHKELGRSFTLMIAIFAVLGFYVFGGRGMVYEYIIQTCGLIITLLLVWRVETLSDLSISQSQDDIEEEIIAEEGINDGGLPDITYDNIGLLLQQHCIDTKLYLQHDLSLSQLAKTIGTNRSYLSLYFSHKGMTYNAYINDLRINHFIDLFRKAVSSRHLVTAQQLAHKSGYKSYSTFSLAFKQRMGVAVTTWMHDNGK